MKKTALEIFDSSVSNEDRHDWLASASVEELYEFLRWVRQDSSWALHGRDALNVLLAKENIKLQKDIRDMTAKMQKMTQWVTGLTVVIAILTLLQAYTSIKTIFNDIKIFRNPPQTESTTNQSTETTQLHKKNDKMLKET